MGITTSVGISGLNLVNDRMSDNRDFYSYMLAHPSEAAAICLSRQVAQENALLQGSFAGKTYHRQAAQTITAFNYQSLGWKIKGAEISPSGTLAKVGFLNINDEIAGRLHSFTEVVEDSGASIELPDGRVIRGVIVAVSPFLKRDGKFILPNDFAEIVLMTTNDHPENFFYSGKLNRPEGDRPIAYQVDTTITFDGQPVELRSETYTPVFHKVKNGNTPGKFKHFAVTHSDRQFVFEG